ncbi:MAG: MFS transporter [Muribaculaceae bacterium]|nr:MFS transporter [Muribaculaceae bacterium]
MKKSLLSLAFGTFALGIAEFGMMGILNDIAADLDISVVQAGHLISAYSAGVAVGAPGLLFLRKLPLRRLMLLLAAIISIGNALVALSPGYVFLLVSRFISGLPHGAFFGAGAIVCSRLADQGKGASAVAVLVGGMTVANLVGVSLFTFICNLLSWRLPFGIVALIGAFTFVAVRSWVPVLPALPDTGMKGQFRFLSKPEPWLIYAGVFFGQASVYCWLSYISPIMTRVAGFSEASMSAIMVLVGAGMVAGNLLSGRLADRHSPSLVTAIIASCAIVLMPVIYFCAADRILSLLFAFLAPAVLFGLGGPLQYLIVRYSKGGEMLGGAGIQIAFNVSNAMAAVLGGAVIRHGYGLASPALAGVPCAVIGALALFVLYNLTGANKKSVNRHAHIHGQIQP